MPPLSEQQRQAIEAAWGRGVRDKASLFAAAGIGVPGTPTAVVPAAVPPPVPGQLPPPGEGFIEQGGLLGLAARTPGTEQLLQGLGWLGEKVLSPTSTAGVVAAQRLIPGQQMREEAFDLGAAEARARGEGIFGQIGAAFAGGAHEAFDTPITTGIGINLPGQGISIPDWIAGKGKRLDEIDIGQLAAELPAEILGTKGAGKLTRPARWATASKFPTAAPFLIKPPRKNLSRKYYRERPRDIETVRTAPRSPWEAPAVGMMSTRGADVRIGNLQGRDIGARPSRAQGFVENVDRPLAAMESLAVPGIEGIRRLFNKAVGG